MSKPRLNRKTRNDGCRDFQQLSQVSRREILRIGGLCGVGLSLPELLRAQTTRSGRTRAATFGKAKRIIMLYLHGGHPQQETFDPKPNGPAELRGEFGAIPTTVAGVQFSERLPLTSMIMHKLAVVRSMSHANPNHVTASLPANTGHTHPPNTPQTDFPPEATDFPPFGAVLDLTRRAHNELPNWVRVGPLMRRNNGTVLHGQLPGFLGARHSSFVVDQSLLPAEVKIDAIRGSTDLTSIRLKARKNLLTQFDGHRKLLDESTDARDLDQYYQRAFSILSSAETQRAFNLAAEDRSTRDRYGKTEFGQRCLLARRLAEAGVPMVNVSYCHTPRGSWDTHSGNFKKMKESLGPTLDTSLTALVNDLDERGMLDDTLVIVNAEFGRTPKINRSAGRDHWPWVYSLAVAGAGIRPGVVYGASDAAAAYPNEYPRSQADFAATLYHLMGVPEETAIYDSLDRPHQLVIGRTIDGILA